MPFKESKELELTEKYRPQEFDDIIGQPNAVALLKAFVEEDRVPHVLLLTGPSGCGKTTAGRVLRKHLGCTKDPDYREINMADDRGIDTIRAINSRINTTGFNSSKTRMILLDEVHQATKDAQTAALKIFEGTPNHMYFVLCTTEPNKLLRTIQTRCHEIKFRKLEEQELYDLLATIAEKEQINLSEECARKIADVADGSPRKAIKILESVSVLDNEEQRLDIIQSSESKQQAIELCRILFRGKGGSFKEAAAIVKKLEDEPEQVRQLVLSYATTVCLSGGKFYMEAARVLDCFRETYHYNGKAGLTMSIFEFYHTGS